jgi:hypothetical protein
VPEEAGAVMTDVVMGYPWVDWWAAISEKVRSKFSCLQKTCHLFFSEREYSPRFYVQLLTLG